MTTKKFANIEEARAKAEDVQSYLSDKDATIGENTNSVWLQNTDEQEIIAEFIFEPGAPALVIGDWHKFWDIKEDWIIAKLDRVHKSETGSVYTISHQQRYLKCEPFDLVDPVEHKKLKRNLEALAADYEKVVAKNKELEELSCENCGRDLSHGDLVLMCGSCLDDNEEA